MLNAKVDASLRATARVWLVIAGVGLGAVGASEPPQSPAFLAEIPAPIVGFPDEIPT